MSVEFVDTLNRVDTILFKKQCLKVQVLVDVENTSKNANLSLRLTLLNNFVQVVEQV